MHVNGWNYFKTINFLSVVAKYAVQCSGVEGNNVFLRAADCIVEACIQRAK